MKICSARNFLILFAFLIAYSFVLSPMLMWRSRDQRYDLYNIFKKAEILKFELLNCESPTKSSKSRPNCTQIWVNDSIPYLTNKYILNKSFEIPIYSNTRENLTNSYLQLKVKQAKCKNGCPVLQQKTQLIKWILLPPDESHILISGNAATPTPAPSPTPVPYRYRTVRFNLLDHDIINMQIVAPWSYNQITVNQRQRTFHPVLSVDDFYDIPSQRRMIDLNRTNFSVNVEVKIQKEYVWNMKNAIQYSFDMFQKNYQTDILSITLNEMKRAYVETNPILLWTTIVAQVLHSIFQVLAFEKDVEFWTKKDSLVGVSLRTILLQFGGQIIIFLNLLESKKIPLFMKALEFGGLCIQVWKIMRLVKLSKKFPFFKVRKEYRGETDEADEAGLKYLSYALVPLVIGYSLYQLFNVKYRSVKSYLLHCLSGAVYSFGFLAMLPQLYVNYRLKTVAGMSRNAFVYKFITTFIDDLYTFVSDLPLMYKIACFRDDVVFFIWIFQCFIYPVDPSRVNEFGYVEKDGDKSETKKEINDESEGSQKVCDESENSQKVDDGYGSSQKAEEKDNLNQKLKID